MQLPQAAAPIVARVSDRILSDVRVQASHSYRHLGDHELTAEVRVVSCYLSYPVPVDWWLCAQGAVVAYGLEHSATLAVEKSTITEAAIVAQPEKTVAELPSVLQSIVDSHPYKAPLPKPAAAAAKPPSGAVPVPLESIQTPAPGPSKSEPGPTSARVQPPTAPQHEPVQKTVSPERTEPNSLLAKARALLEAKSEGDGVMTSAVDEETDSDVSSVHTSDVSLSDSNDEVEAQPAPRRRK